MDSQKMLSQSGGFIKRGWAEFRDFAFKGNMLDLAIAVVIGAAFKTVIDSMVNDIVTPIIQFALSHLGGSKEMAGIHVVSPWAIHLSNLVGALINFLITAFVIFVIFVKLIGAFMKRASAPPPPSEPTTKECPMCLSMIPIKARKCANCTSDLPVPA